MVATSAGEATSLGRSTNGMSIPVDGMSSGTGTSVRSIANTPVFSNSEIAPNRGIRLGSSRAIRACSCTFFGRIVT